MTELDQLKIRMAWLCSTEYQPHDDCKASEFVCDFRPKGDESSDQCPCQWAKDFKFIYEHDGDKT